MSAVYKESRGVGRRLTLPWASARPSSPSWGCLEPSAAATVDAPQALPPAMVSSCEVNELTKPTRGQYRVVWERERVDSPWGT